MINERIVKVVNNRAGHSYRMDGYYKVSKTPSSSANCIKLEEIVKVTGLALPVGSNIYLTDCEFIDVFTNNEELIEFLKAREDLMTTWLVAALSELTEFKDALNMMKDFGSKEEYLVSHISDCKEALSSDEDAGCKKIVELLANLV